MSSLCQGCISLVLDYSDRVGTQLNDVEGFEDSEGGMLG